MIHGAHGKAHSLGNILYLGTGIAFVDKLGGAHLENLG